MPTLDLGTLFPLRPAVTTTTAGLFALSIDTIATIDTYLTQKTLGVFIR